MSVFLEVGDFIRGMAIWFGVGFITGMIVDNVICRKVRKFKNKRNGDK